MNRHLTEKEVLFFLSQFHGHIGPYVVLGYRAGLIAARELGDDPFCKRAVVFTGVETPLSCFIDGIQIGSCCTLGKGNITVEDKCEARVRFESKDGSRTVEVSLLDETLLRISRADSWEQSHQLGHEMLSEPEEKLFLIKINEKF